MQNNINFKSLAKLVTNISVLKNLVHRISGILVDRSISIIINIFIARSTSNEEFGTILLIYSVADVFISLFDFGITLSAVVEFNKNLNRSQSIFLRLFVYKLVVIPLIIPFVMFSISSISFGQVIGYVLLIVLVEGLTDALQVINCVYYAKADFGKLFRSVIISRSCQAIAVVIAVINNASVYILLGSHFIHLIAQFLFLLPGIISWYNSREITDAGSSVLSYFRKYASMGWNKIVIVFAGRFDQIQLTTFLSAASLSIYGVAQTFNRNLNIVGNNIGVVYQTEMSEHLSDKIHLRKILLSGIIVSAVIGVVLSLTIFAISEFLINLLWGMRYSDSVLISYLLSIALPFEFANATMGHALNLLEFSRFNLWLKLGYFILGLSLNFILIPLLGLFGVVYSYLSLSILQSLVMIYFIRKNV